MPTHYDTFLQPRLDDIADRGGATAASALPPEPGGPPRFPSFRVRNCRVREALSWSPLYRDHRAGLAR
jgi:hypothetical protein